MKKLIVGMMMIVLCIFISCSDTAKNSSSDSEESCTKPIKDPNHPKPMALMMRTMANYCDSMRLKINQGIAVDSTQYPLMPFWSAEPTDSSVLEELYFNNAKEFASAYRLLMSSPDNQQEHYTAVINQCINCHNSYCSGPLKRIRKLPLDYKGN